MNLEKQAIPKWLRENYLLKGVPKVTLLRSYTNDVYEVTDKNNKYVLKIYGKGWRTLDDICWEIELLEFIGKKGLLISKAVPAIDDKFVKSMGDQFAVLYNFAPGEKPQKPFTPDLYFLFGQAMGKIHKLSDDFKPISKKNKIVEKWLKKGKRVKRNRCRDLDLSEYCLGDLGNRSRIKK